MSDESNCHSAYRVKPHAYEQWCPNSYRDAKAGYALQKSDEGKTYHEKLQNFVSRHLYEGSAYTFDPTGHVYDVI